MTLITDDDKIYHVEEESMGITLPQNHKIWCYISWF